MKNEKSIFDTLYEINVNDKTDKRGNLTYLSWAWAWTEAKKLFPDVTRKVYETEDGVNYFTDGRSCWVKVGVTIGGIEHIDYLPVMDFRNQSISVEKVTSFDVNKAIQRSTTKALALHGLGIYIYAKEDTPEKEGKEAIKEEIDPIKKKLTPELFERACNSIKEGRYTIEELEEMFELNKSQKAKINKIKKEQ